MKQEQQEASPEVEEVAPDVLRMQLPIQMPGLGHVNMYCLLDSEGAAVVDPGLPGEDTWQAIEERLQQAGLRPKDVHTVVVTHSHPDHFGGAGRFFAETGCQVIAHRAFRVMGKELAVCTPEPSVDDLDDRLASPDGAAEPDPYASRRPLPVERSDQEPWPSSPPQQSDPTPWGGKPRQISPEQRARWEKMREAGQAFLPQITHVVEHGSMLRLARREWFVWFTPGHTADHICLHDPVSSVFVAGDHVLPSITPHISGLSDRADPLQAFYDSLDTVAGIEGAQHCLPAHGHPFFDLQSRARAIRAHHDERLTRIREIGQGLGAASVEAYSCKLFKRRSWGPMAESETYAHLEHLRLRGQAERHRDEAGLLIYET
ncbi:MAG: MBL fold metallo-hydrolase [Myxococcales bacterium]|nr:MBL fold metallo-hydrolase [Myxococcales bacterium]